MNPNDIRDINDLQQTSCDLDELIAHAKRKRAIYPWNDWGKRMSYTDLIATRAALVDHWPDPAFNQDGDPHIWLRAEVWRHPDGTHYRALLAPVREGVHNSGTVVVEPLQCCARHDSTDVGQSSSPPSKPPANEDGWIDTALVAAYEDRTTLPDAD